MRLLKNLSEGKEEFGVKKEGLVLALTEVAGWQEEGALRWGEELGLDLGGLNWWEVDLGSVVVCLRCREVELVKSCAASTLALEAQV